MNQQKIETFNKRRTKRAFVGNLSYNPDVEDRVRALFSRSAIPVRDLSIVPLKQPNTKCYALVECDVEMAIKCLHGVKFDGGILSVQHERKTGKPKKSNSKGFGGGWAAPSRTPNPLLDKPAPSLSEKMKNMSLIPESSVTEDGAANIVNPAVNKMVPPTSSSDDVSEFHSRCKLSLDNLMQEYGSYDPDYEKMKAMQFNTSQNTSAYMVENKCNCQSLGMLASNGKAPIHVEVVSFGYKYSVPPQARDGWSHSNPLSPIDCRDLPRCPHYVAKLSGLSHKVKRAMLRLEKDDDNENSDNESDIEESPIINPLVTKSEKVSESIIRALEEAINEGGHGYAFPLEVTIFLGSEYGRHRSVVLCEIVAQNIRNLLRRNEGNRISQPVSVSTRHRDVDKKHRDEEAFGVDLRREHEAEMKRKKKQEWLDSRW